MKIANNSKHFTFTTLFFIVILTISSIHAADLIPPQDFESGLAGWAFDSAVWQRGAPLFGPPGVPLAHNGSSNCVATNLSANYSPNDSGVVETPYFSIPSNAENPRLQFWHWLKYNSGDYGYVQITFDNGLNWHTLKTFIATSIFSYDWVFTSIDLSDYKGFPLVKLRFLFDANGDGGVSEGWYLDDIEVKTGPYQVVVDTIQDFENGYGDWSLEHGTAWELGTPIGVGPDSSHSGNACVGTNLSGNYAKNDSGRFVSPLFIVPPATANPRLQFWHWLNYNSGDSGYVQITIDGGQNWITLDSYRAESIGSYGWVFTSIDLTSHAGDTVQLGFIFDANGDGAVSEGWYLDDIVVKTGPYQVVVDSTQDFENGYGDWSLEQGTAWQLGTPIGVGPDSSHSGNACIGTNMSGFYAKNDSGRFISPLFIVPPATANPRLQFWHWLKYNSGDSGYVQITIDGDQNWITLDSYRAESIGSYGWVFTSIDLTSHAGDTVQLGFIFDANGDGAVSEGWYLDDIVVKTGPYQVVVDSTQDFENGYGDWSLEQGTAWQLGTPISPSGPGTGFLSSYCLGTNLSGFYAKNDSGRFVSPPFIVPDTSLDSDYSKLPNPRLQFWNWFDFASGDFGAVQISTDSGTNWTTLQTFNQSNTDTGWVQVSIDLGLYALKRAQFGFIFDANGDGAVSEGWYLDDIEVTTTDTVEVFPNDTIVFVARDSSDNQLDAAGINLRITDPKGFVIEADSNGILHNNITGATYSNVYGNDTVIIVSPLKGEYIVEVNGEALLSGIPDCCAVVEVIKLSSQSPMTLYQNGTDSSYIYGPFERPPFGVTSNVSSIAIAIKVSTDIGDGTDFNIPDHFDLKQNYPNPFNPSTKIEYALSQKSQVNLTVYNSLGQIVATLVNQQQAAGVHQVTWNGTNNRGEKVSSGLYLYKLKTDNSTFTKKMLLLK